MKRSIDYYLHAWKTDRYRKPLLLRGARQVGKTHAARTLETNPGIVISTRFSEIHHRSRNRYHIRMF